MCHGCSSSSSLVQCSRASRSSTFSGSFRNIVASGPTSTPAALKPLWRLLLLLLVPETCFNPPSLPPLPIHHHHTHLQPDQTGHLCSHSETGEWGLCVAGNEELSGENKGGREKRAGHFRCDPVSEIPCCGTPDRRQLKAIRIQLLSGCTLQQQQQQQDRCEYDRIHVD